MNKRIDVHHVTRVEGHGNIVVEVVDGEMKECRFDVVETPRFFEAMLRGRPYLEASHITSRICGICATGHATASLRASENALGVRAERADPTAAQADFPRRNPGQPYPACLHAGRARFPGRGQRHPAGNQPSGRGPARPAHEEAGRRHLRRGRRTPHPPHRHDGRRLHPLPHSAGAESAAPAPGRQPRRCGRHRRAGRIAALAEVRARHGVHLAQQTG